MEISARPAGPEDRAAVVQLLVDAAAATGAERGGELFNLREGAGERFEPDVAAWERDGRVCLAVGLVDGVVVGVAVARLESLPGGGLLARLEHLFVDAAAREVGVGEAILRLVVTWAQAGGASHLDAYALPGNRSAKNFLESSGFTARLIVMSRELP